MNSITIILSERGGRLALVNFYKYELTGEQKKDNYEEKMFYLRDPSRPHDYAVLRVLLKIKAERWTRINSIEYKIAIRNKKTRIKYKSFLPILKL